ncbi:MAG TPA: hypothetical protein VD838_10880, partial [Anaeromyxobacteraceae bacterium]|nr:hypothetical protein [Anaeromyxobacteraceae bacterium]
LELDPVQHALVDAVTGKAWRVGDEVEVEVVHVSPQRRRIELAVVGEGRNREAGRGAETRARPVEIVEAVVAGPGRSRRREVAAMPAERTGRPRREHRPAKAGAAGRGAATPKRGKITSVRGAKGSARAGARAGKGGKPKDRRGRRRSR